MKHEVLVYITESLLSEHLGEVKFSCPQNSMHTVILIKNIAILQKITCRESVKNCVMSRFHKYQLLGRFKSFVIGARPPVSPDVLASRESITCSSDGKRS